MAIKRFIENLVSGNESSRQMRWIAGPRQTGKTTLVKKILKEKGCSALYYNWDQRVVRTRFRKEPYFFHTDALSFELSKDKWICFDEIHKRPKWKDILKDVFDTHEDRYRFIVTGSARLDLFRKSGDGLSGRYFLYKLMPVSLFELTRHPFDIPTESAPVLIEKRFQSGSQSQPSDFETLLKFGGFPEPLTKGDSVFSAQWHRGYIETLVREDLRDLTKVHDLENVITLMKLLPAKIGSPLSLNSLREDLEISHNAVRSYVNALVLTYIIFKVPPFSKKINNAIKKENKVYFFDWTLAKDPAARFENYVACELNHWTQLWTSVSENLYELSFVRMRDGRETDFLVTRDGEPFFLVEVKLSADVIATSNINHAEMLGNIPLIQVVQKPGILKAQSKTAFVVSAERFF